MRNYVKMLFMQWTDAGGNTYYAWGADDDQLLEYVRRKENAAIEHGALRPFTRTPPRVLYWLLDEKNLGIILNGAYELTSFQNWTLTALFDGPAFPPFAYFQINFRDLTRTKDEGSPRKTWSHGK